MPEALVIVSEQIDHPALQKIIVDVIKQVHAGVTLSRALERYPTIFDYITVHMVYVGQEGAALATALEMLWLSIETLQNFKKQIRSAALMPCLTLLFFFLIAFIIVVAVIPRFAVMFATFRARATLAYPFY